MLALIPIRRGELPAGAAETTAECGGRVLLVGSGADVDLGHVATDVRVVEIGEFAPGRWADALAPIVADDDIVVLPGSPDGRDLAPRLAQRLGRPLHAGAVEVTATRITVARRGGLELHTFTVDEPAVATLQPGVRGVEPPRDRDPAAPCERLQVDARPDGADAEVVAVHPPDVTTMDLAEARCIAAGGAGLDGAERFEQLTRIAARLGGAMGASRVITDRGWVPHERQIGTTGVVVAPELYLAFGISGAVQHVAGLGDPERIVSVNVDPHCPMMQMADLAVVSDANAVLDELARQLELDGG
jgi:electron transfer flavoprotein alpha subunit